MVLICGLLGNLQVRDEFFDSQPLFCATSPADFWGRRWNSLVHRNLMEGVYKPVRAVVASPYSKPVAVAATFVVSGLLHEYVWALLFFRTHLEHAEGNACRTCYEYVRGKHLILFGWNGMLLLLEESRIGKIVEFLFSGWLKTLPSLVRSILVVLAALPEGHLFTEDLLDGGYFTQLHSPFHY